MNKLVRHATIVSTVALMTAATAGWASAQGYDGQNGADGQDGNDGRSGYCVDNPDQCGTRRMRQRDLGDESDQGYTKKRRVQMDEDQVQTDTPRRHAQSDWKFDPNKHRRHRHRSDEFRFEFGGFWYPEPYWLGYGLVGRPYRIGCGEGRAIVRDQGFYRVRTVECYGRAYTYIGRRHGDTFQVLVSARSGRIIDVDPI
jgi:hypothetical protein